MQMGSQITGQEVFSVESGTNLGKVRDLYFDANIERLVAISLGGRFFGLNARVIHLKDVVALGKDVVLIKHINDMQNKGEVPTLDDWVSYSDLRKRKMRTTNNIPVGNVDDVSIDEDGNVFDFALVWTQIKGPIGESHRVSRRAVTDVGHESNIILIDLATAEHELTIQQ